MTTKYAACVLALCKDGRILTTTRRNTDVLALPGGKRDQGESLYDCAIRETLEETGVNLAGLDSVRLFSDVEYGADGHDFSVDAFGILIHSNSADIVIPGGKETGITVGWHTPLELLCKGTFVRYNANVLKSAMAIDKFKEYLRG